MGLLGMRGGIGKCFATRAVPRLSRTPQVRGRADSGIAVRIVRFSTIVGVASTGRSGTPPSFEEAQHLRSSGPPTVRPAGGGQRVPQSQIII